MRRLFKTLKTFALLFSWDFWKCAICVRSCPTRLFVHMICVSVVADLGLMLLGRPPDVGPFEIVERHEEDPDELF